MEYNRQAVKLITKGSYNSKNIKDMIHDQFELLHKAEDLKNYSSTI